MSGISDDMRQVLDAVRDGILAHGKTAYAETTARLEDAPIMQAMGDTVGRHIPSGD